MNYFFLAILSLSIFSAHNIKAAPPVSSHFASNDIYSNVSNALRCLDEAIELSAGIRDGGAKDSIIHYLTALRNDIQKAMQDKDFSHIYESCAFLHENADEILAECDYELRVKITSCICSMMKGIEAMGF